MREVIECGLKASEQSELTALHHRIEQLEESIKALVGGGIDTVNADFWQANEVLLLFMKDALAQAAEHDTLPGWASAMAWTLRITWRRRQK